MSSLVLLVALVASAFFSGSEIAFLSANRLQLEIDLKRKSIPFWGNALDAASAALYRDDARG